MTYSKDAGMVAGVAAIVDYTGIVDRIIGGSGSMGMSAALASSATVFVMHMMYKKKYSSAVFPVIGAGIASGISEMILQAILGSRIQNPQILGAMGVFLGTYIAVDKANE